MSHAFPDRSFQSPSPRRSTIDIEEQRAWVGFYRRVGRDVALAAEVMAQLDGDAEMKRRHLALYLSCKQSLRVHKARQARDKRIGQWLRVLVQWTLQRPAAFVGGVTQKASGAPAGICARSSVRTKSNTLASAMRLLRRARETAQST